MGRSFLVTQEHSPLLKQHVIDHIKPVEEAVDDRPQHRMVVGVGDRDSERGAKTNAVLSAFNAVILLRRFDYRPKKFVGG